MHFRVPQRNLPGSGGGPAPQYVVDLPRGRRPELRVHLGVDVSGDRDAGVAQLFRYDLQGDASLQRQAPVGTPQAVERPGDPYAPREPSEGRRQSIWMPRCTGTVVHDQVLQVSPSGVGLDNQQLINLRRQLLFDFDHGHVWENPTASFFDLARIRYGDVITLREHFRCVPEIIGFSNRIAYEPDRVPLIPLRQYGIDRLEPIRTVHVEDGYRQGSAGKAINPPRLMPSSKPFSSAALTRPTMARALE